MTSRAIKPKGNSDINRAEDKSLPVDAMPGHRQFFCRQIDALRC